MANHKSALKRIRSNEVRRIRRRYYAKTMRNAIKKFRNLQRKNEALAALPKIVSMIDKMAKKSIIHKNKAANLKSKLTKKVNLMAE
ncbi:MAG TPA: 30S ribosomal protein S20 [Bacteroidales bacterium]|nr:30S ribosomal protein S20 [Bacteroidales bacterium]